MHFSPGSSLRCHHLQSDLSPMPNHTFSCMTHNSSYSLSSSHSELDSSMKTLPCLKHSSRAPSQPPASPFTTRRPRISGMVLFFLFAQSALIHHTAALVINAPELCGGRRVATHASALFGPDPSDSGVLRTPVFAPYPESSVSATNPAPLAAVARTDDADYVQPSPIPILSEPEDSNPRFQKISRVMGERLESKSSFGADQRTNQNVDPMIRSQNPSISDLEFSSSSRRNKFSIDPIRRENRSWDRRVPSPFLPILVAMRRHTRWLLNMRLLFGLRNRHLFTMTPLFGGLYIWNTEWASHVQSSSQVHQDSSTSSDSHSHVDTPCSEKLAVRAQSTPDARTDIDSQQSRMYALSDACEPLEAVTESQTRGKVAVVTRGNCDFSEKVLRMQRAGAVGVVVINYQRDGERLANMKLNESKVVPEPIRIPAVMISFKDWAFFAPCRDDIVSVSFTREGETTFDIDYGREALNWAMMRGMALWILCQCGINVIRYKRRIAELRARADAIAALPVEIYSRVAVAHSKTPELPPPNSTCTSARSQTNSSSRRKKTRDVHEHSRAESHSADTIGESSSDFEHLALLTSDEGLENALSSSRSFAEEDEPVCAVCLEGFEDGQRVRRLECTHMYHAVCLDPWLTQSSNCCPVCKREVPNLPPPPTILHYGSTTV